MFCTVCANPLESPYRPCGRCGAVSATGAAVEPRPADHAIGLRRVNALPFLVFVVVLLVFGGRALEQRRQERQHYGAGRAALAAGDLLAAKGAYAEAGDYADAEFKRREVDARLAPYAAAKERAKAAIGAGRFDDAIAALIPVVQALPGDEQAWALLAEARKGRVAALDQRAAAAEQTGDWLTAQQTLTALLAERPDDAAVASRLAAVKRDHAPIVYTRDGDLYVSGPDEASERLILKGMNVSWPMWSPDQTMIAFATRSGARGTIAGNLYVINADGSGLRLLSTECLPFPWPVWSPDGTRIAFSNPSHFQVGDGSGSINLAVVELATGRMTDVTHDQFDYAASPTWSPDGTRLAYVDRIRIQMGNGFDFKNGDVHLADLVTGRTANLTGDTLQNERQVIWSPVADRLLIYTDPGDWNSQDEGQIVVWDLATSAMTVVPTDVRSPEPAMWSPDGSMLAWVEGTDTVKLWSAAGVRWVRLSTNIGPALSWAPDGHAILAPGSSRSEPSYLIAVDRQFGSRIILKLEFDVNNGTTGLPVWAPRTVPAAPLSTGGTALDPAQ